MLRKRRVVDSDLLLQYEQGVLDKTELIKDILYQMDFQCAQRKEIANISEERMIEEMSKLPLSILLSYYLSMLDEKEVLQLGYELNGLVVDCAPRDTYREMLKVYPDFTLEDWLI